MSGQVARMTKMRNVYEILIGKHEGKEPLGRPRSKLERSIKMDLKETGWDGLDWINLAHYRHQRWVPVHTVMNFWVP
jgi:hypothetical protein